MIHNSRLTAAALTVSVLAALTLAAGCSSDSSDEFATGTWAGPDAVLVAAGDSVTLNGGCYGFTVHHRLFVHDGAFAFNADVGFSTTQHESVNVEGSVSGGTVTFAMRPGIADSVGSYALARDGVLPWWYPGKAECIQ
ncbi:MAG: hypothetical protein ACREL5_12085 [Gemmatimonadales bacterium]